MGPFNNREIASAFWLLLLLLFCLKKAEFRRSVWALFRSFMRFKIVLPIFLMAAYTAAVVLALADLGLWNTSLLKDTIVWFFIGAMAMMMRYVTADELDDIFQSVLIDNVKIIIVLEFLVNAYTFWLPVELILVLLLTVLAATDAYAESRQECADVAKVTGGLMAVGGFVILAVAVGRSIHDFQNLQSLDTLRSVALAPLLSLAFTPFLYCMVLVSKYEYVFLRIKLGMKKEAKLKRYARWRIMRHAGLSVSKVQHLLKHHAADLMQIQTEEDVERVVQRPGVAHEQSPRT